MGRWCSHVALSHGEQCRHEPRWNAGADGRRKAEAAARGCRHVTLC